MVGKAFHLGRGQADHEAVHDGRCFRSTREPCHPRQQVIARAPGYGRDRRIGLRLTMTEDAGFKHDRVLNPLRGGSGPCEQTYARCQGAEHPVSVFPGVGPAEACTYSHRKFELHLFDNPILIILIFCRFFPKLSPVVLARDTSDTGGGNELGSWQDNLGIACSRRVLCLGAASALMLGLAGQGAAADQDVRSAIAADFGDADLPDGEILIDMPDFSDSGKSVPLTVTVPCTMQGLDYPETVAVYAARNPRPRVVSVHFTPACSEATFSTRVRIDAYQDIIIVVKMASGAMFKRVRKVDVTYGACEDAIANDQFPPGWSPSIRLAVPKVATAGAAVEIRTIIGHPMETGFRHNAQGLLIPVRIAETFRCSANGETVFSAKLEPAIAANPYFAFKLRVEKTMQLRFEWVDTTSDIYSDEATIIVA